MKGLSMARGLYSWLSVLVVISAIVGGCGEEEGPGPVELTSTGVVVVDCYPDEVEPTWELEGPEASLVAGIGDSTLVEQKTGDYNLLWGDVSGWTTPEDEVRLLASGATAVFRGEYIQSDLNGTIIVNSEPDALLAPWVLTGPETYYASGNGDSTLLNIEEGDYTLDWGDVDDWAKPNPSNVSQSLASGDTVTFDGIYSQTGTIIVDPEPNSINFPWVLTGPEEYSAFGYGDSTLINIEEGDYTLAWGDVTGWTPPANGDIPQTIVQGETMTFAGIYTCTIIVNPQPNSINATWQLTGPDEYEYSGVGDETLPGLYSGEYRVCWEEVTGWTAPDPDCETIALAGWSSLLGLYTEEADLGPVACCTAAPDSGVVTTVFIFDASCSYDQGGPAGDLQYRWDWEADGTYDYPAAGDFSADPVALHTFSDEGRQSIKVQVMDPTGNLDTGIVWCEVTEAVQGER
ncbi:MAG: hypothetical protein KOO60_12920 [Gemmatimonadales bacterium]|nr:hypothetical protein [Gemmatimonadales bacterium]